MCSLSELVFFRILRGTFIERRVGLQVLQKRQSLKLSIGGEARMKDSFVELPSSQGSLLHDNGSNGTISTVIPSDHGNRTVEINPTKRPIVPTSLRSVNDSKKTVVVDVKKPSTIRPPAPEVGINDQTHDMPYKCSKKQLLHYCRNHRIVSTCTDSRNVILFIVNFHNPFYSLIPFFEQSYFATFCRLFNYDFDFLFVGPQVNSSHVLDNGLPTKGYLSFMSLTRTWDYLYQSVPSYLGFFVMNDDSCLNPLLLNSFDYSKSFTEGRSTYHPNSGWYWNRQNNSRGIPYPVAFRAATSEIARLRSEYRECMKEENWKNGWSDSFYVAQKDVSRVQFLFSVMFHHEVFLEMALPTSMNCIAAKAIVSCNHNGNRSVLNYHMHPVKFSVEENRNMCLQRMQLTRL